MLRISTAFFVGLFILGCRRDHERPEDHEKPQPSAAASNAVAPSTATSSSAAPNVASPPTASDTTTNSAESVPAEFVGKIRTTSGEALIDLIARSGNKATIVNTWASWCGPCRREFPMLVALRENLKPRGVDIVFVSVDEPEGYGPALDFAQSNGEKPPLWVAERPLGPFKRALSPSWKGMLPATFLFDGGGKLRYFWGGPVYDNELLPIVEGFLRGEKIDGEAVYGLTPGVDYREQ